MASQPQDTRKHALVPDCCCQWGDPTVEEVKPELRMQVYTLVKLNSQDHTRDATEYSFSLKINRSPNTQ